MLFYLMGENWNWRFHIEAGSERFSGDFHFNFVEYVMSCVDGCNDVNSLKVSFLSSSTSKALNSYSSARGFKALDGEWVSSYPERDNKMEARRSESESALRRNFLFITLGTKPIFVFLILSEFMFFLSSLHEEFSFRRASST